MLLNLATVHADTPSMNSPFHRAPLNSVQLKKTGYDLHVISLFLFYTWAFGLIVIHGQLGVIVGLIGLFCFVATSLASWIFFLRSESANFKEETAKIQERAVARERLAALEKEAFDAGVTLATTKLF